MGNAGVPVSDGYANPGPIENGVVTCKDDYCTTNCDLMYDWYNGQSKTKCKLNGNGKWAWTNQLGECKTCGPLKLNTAEIDVKLTIVSNQTILHRFLGRLFYTKIVRSRESVLQNKLQE